MRGVSIPWILIGALAFALVLGQTDPAKAQGLDFTSRKSDSPVEIYADQGLELSQDARTVIARVNAKAIRGNVTLSADVIVAHYRDKSEAPQNSASRQKPGRTAAAAGNVGNKAASDPVTQAEGSGSEIWRVEAQGHVVISTPTQTITAEYGDYNIDNAVVVLTGNNLKLTTPTDVVTARDSMEYWEQRQQAVARGDAVAVRGDERIQADVLVADFGQDKTQKSSIQRAHAYDHVILTTPREVVTGDRADYVVETGIVTVTGSVKMTRDNNQLDGGYAVVNLNTGISRLLPSPPGGGQGQRVKGLFVPHSGDADAAPAAPAPTGNAGWPR